MNWTFFRKAQLPQDGKCADLRTARAYVLACTPAACGHGDFLLRL